MKICIPQNRHTKPEKSVVIGMINSDIKQVKSFKIIQKKKIYYQR
jgi:hypothetical protein